MSQEPNNISNDLRGVSSLTVDAVVGATDLVESLHATITSASRVVGEPRRKRKRGVVGLVYRHIRTMTELVGLGIDVPLNQLGLLLGEQESSPQREAILSALNGFLGDHLATTNNPLAIPMQLRREGRPLSDDALAQIVQRAGGKIVIMVHGLCVNDLHWHRQGHDHGAALARDLGITPVYVNYNSGLHISENGRNLSALLEKMITHAAQPVELYIVAHSMGGLVARSACYYAESSNHTWRNHLQKMIFLGTPHHGAPLEKGGNRLGALLGISPYSAPFSRLGKVRSSGITDLRYGNVVDADWQGRNRFELTGDQRTHVPLPQDVHCYALAATTDKALYIRGEDIIGDGLVPVSSALGDHKNDERNLIFPEAHQWIGRPMNHIDLLTHPDVYKQIRMWLASA
mgnify:CR=1 FL=1